MRQNPLLLATTIGAVLCGSLISGCASPNGGRAAMAPAVEPLTEREFDAFANDIADQLIAWLERTDVAARVTIAGPGVARECAEQRGVARAFAARLAEGLNDRLLGTVQFAPAHKSRSRLHSEVSFSNREQYGHARALEFRLWDAQSNTELCRWACEYRARPRKLEDLPGSVERPRFASAPPKAQQANGSVPVPPNGVKPQRRTAATNGAIAASESKRSSEDAPRRTIRIDSHEDGLGRQLLEQADDYADRTVRGKSGRIVFLDSPSWEGLRVLRSSVKRTSSGRLKVVVRIQSRDIPKRADIRIVYFDKQGRQLEASAVRTIELSPRFARPLALTSSRPGAARYVMLVARGRRSAVLTAPTVGG